MQLIPPSYDSFVNNDYTRFAIYLECAEQQRQRTKIKQRSKVQQMVMKITIISFD